MRWTGRRPPERIETVRLVLRRSATADAAALNEAANASAEELRPFVPWASDLPHTLAQTRARLELQVSAFDADDSYGYTVLDRAEHELLGGAGLFPRIGPGGLEIGYWVRSDAAARGIATEAAAALVDAGFAAGAEYLELHIDPANARSLRIPPKLGFEPVADAAGNLLVFRRLRAA